MATNDIIPIDTLPTSRVEHAMRLMRRIIDTTPTNGGACLSQTDPAWALTAAEDLIAARAVFCIQGQADGDYILWPRAGRPNPFVLLGVAA